MDGFAAAARVEGVVAIDGKYVLALKGNQSGIEADVELFLADPATRPDDVASTTDAAHGRIEERRATVYAAPWLACDGAFLSREWKDALWAKFCTVRHDDRGGPSRNTK